MLVSSRRMVAAGIAVMALSVSACSSKTTSSAAPAASNNSSSATGGGAAKSVGVILPDTKSSARWENFDKPALTKAFAAAGITADIQNAQGDKAKEVTIADSMIANKVGALIFVSLDDTSGGQIISKAHAANIKVIDYDRLTLGGGADFYVSFDNALVGKLQGEALLKCLGSPTPATKILELAGSPTDNNATLFSAGANEALKGKVTMVDKKAVPDWDNVKGGEIFTQQLTAAGGKIDGVLAANDGLGNAVITVLKAKGLKVPVTGQDATAGGLQNILRGDQCMTVFKSSAKEAEAAASLATAIVGGKDATSLATAKTKDTKANKDVPSLLLPPVSITKETVKDVIADGQVKKEDVCKDDVAALCGPAGIS